MYRSRLDLDDKQRSGVNDFLQSRLSDALDLASRLKRARWNEKGSNFQQFHTLFDSFCTTPLRHADMPGERIVTLASRMGASSRRDAVRHYRSIRLAPRGAAASRSACLFAGDVRNSHLRRYRARDRALRRWVR